VWLFGLKEVPPKLMAIGREVALIRPDEDEFSKSPACR